MKLQKIIFAYCALLDLFEEGHCTEGHSFVLCSMASRLRSRETMALSSDIYYHPLLILYLESMVIQSRSTAVVTASTPPLCSFYAQ